MLGLHPAPSTKSYFISVPCMNCHFNLLRKHMAIAQIAALSPNTILYNPESITSKNLNELYIGSPVKYLGEP